MNRNRIIAETEKSVKETLLNNDAGHDWHHIDRVRKTALKISEKYESDKFIIELAALLHDISDYKFNGGDDKESGNSARRFLSRYNIPPKDINIIADIIDSLSYKGADVSTPMKTIEGKIVQDADRLDAMGAIGIARAFVYGGFKNRPIYIPEIEPARHNSFDDYKKNTAPTINHFYEKLLLLKDRLNTDEAKRIAEGRHKFMEEFLNRFYKEWNGED